MKLTSQNEAVTAIGGAETGNFSIEMNEFMAELLSKKLYTDTIAAPIRELTANAHDIMRSIGNTTGTIDIHVPTIYEPYFSVRDYGTGLPHAKVMRNYTTYGASDKRDTDDQVGGMGVGSKSPLAYDGNRGTYTVTSYFEGNKSTYVCYKDVGFPKVTHMHTEPCDEPSGLEVAFDVDAKDIPEFTTKIAKIVQWFKEPSVKLSSENIEIPSPDVLYSNEFGMVLNENGTTTQSVGAAKYTALVGPIAYLIKSFPEMDALVKRVYTGNYKFILNFDISEVDIAASREELLYSDRTQKIVFERLKQCVDKHRAEAQALANTGESTVVKARKFSELFTCFNRPEILPDAFSAIGVTIDRTLLYTGGEAIAELDSAKLKARANARSLFYNRALKLSSIPEYATVLWGNLINSTRKIFHVAPSNKDAVVSHNMPVVNSYATVNGVKRYPCIVINDDKKARPGRLMNVIGKHNNVFVLPVEMLDHEAVTFEISTDRPGLISKTGFKSVAEFRDWCQGVDVYAMSELPVHPSETEAKEPAPEKKKSKPAPTIEAYSVADRVVRQYPISQVNSDSSYIILVSPTDKDYILQDKGIPFVPKNLNQKGTYDKVITNGYCSASDFALGVIGAQVSKFIPHTPFKNVYVINKSAWARFKNNQVAKDFIPAFMAWLKKERKWSVAVIVYEELTDATLMDANHRSFYKAELKREYPILEALSAGSFWWKVVHKAVHAKGDLDDEINPIVTRLKQLLDVMPLMRYADKMNERGVEELIELYEFRDKYLNLTIELEEAA